MKASIKPHLLFLLLFVVLSYSCRKDDPGGGLPPATTYSFPLKTGNAWVYHTLITQKDPNQNLLHKEEYLHRWNVEKDTVINGITCSKIVFVDSNLVSKNSRTYFSYYTQNTAGLFAVANGPAGVPVAYLKKPMDDFANPFAIPFTALNKTGGLYFPDSALYILKYPIKFNESWESNEYGNDYDFMRKYLKKESVTTDAGLFECIKIQRSSVTFSAPAGSYLFYFGKPGFVQYVQESTLMDGNGNTSHLSHITSLVSTNF